MESRRGTRGRWPSQPLATHGRITWAKRTECGRPIGRVRAWTKRRNGVTCEACLRAMEIREALAIG